MYVATIKRLQPHGPYLIGGWSAGGVHAYEVSRQLLQSHNQVGALIILDMHIPRPMPASSKVTPAFVDKIGVATGLNRAKVGPAAMKRLKTHLLHTIQSLSNYNPLPMLESRRPGRTMVVWANKSLSEVFGSDELAEARQAGLQTETSGNVMRDADMDIAAWFFSKRHNFTANGWDILVGGNVECHEVDADHFSLVTAPAVSVCVSIAIMTCKLTHIKINVVGALVERLVNDL